VERIAPGRRRRDRRHFAVVASHALRLRQGRSCGNRIARRGRDGV